MSYNKENGYGSCQESDIMSPYAKFEVETCGTNGLVHIRSCRNNKYLVRTRIHDPSMDAAAEQEEHWIIAATAKKAEEDQTKECCTLFRPICVSLEENTVRLKHVQSGCYLRVCPNSDGSNLVMARHTRIDGEKKMDVFKFFDRQSMLTLPKYVALKGHNDRYAWVHTNSRAPFVHLGTADPGNERVTCEIFHNNDGSIRVKQALYAHRFWRCNMGDSRRIWVDSANALNLETAFKAMQVGDNVIALQSLASNGFCMPVSVWGMGPVHANSLLASSPSIVTQTRFQVEQGFMTSQFSDFRYEIENARIYDEEPFLVGYESDSNFTWGDNTLDVKVKYTDIKTRSWKNSVSLKLGLKTTYKLGTTPIIAKGEIEISTELQNTFEWGETNTKTLILEAATKATVPARTKATVDLIATRGRCDVPFTFTQRDTLFDGTVVISQQTGIFTGSNYYNFEFHTREEPI
ncbi:Aerolysin/hemolysin/leukocidin toxin [Corchorus olitorius]|uniref:Aerolysin/hemolysin/leukocidin toxin n=1 Tax=Corchorus olitorius TaxID=93759 RepID=A0A1R3HT94_9ROSI|nr:Aerolysin/hemolysin/leukocidin toxin [Corchorus olitorius]